MKEPEPEWGLAALGRSGEVAVDVDEAISGPDRWVLTIELARWSLRFAISTPSIVKEFRDYLQKPRIENPEMLLGTIGTGSVKIVKDDEFDDRLFLKVSAIDGTVCFTLEENDTPHLISALSQAVNELNDGPHK